jgi:hypothetical protein
MTFTRKHVRALLATSVGTIAFLVTAASSTPFAAGTLNLRGTLRLVSTPGECTLAAPPDATECRARTGQGLVSGLGSVSESYTWSFRMGPPTCPSDVGKPLATTGRLVVVGKGEVTSRSRTEPGASIKSPSATSRRTSRSRAARVPTKGRPGAARSSVRLVQAWEPRGGRGRSSSPASSST